MLIAANKIDVPGADKNLERLKEKYPDYVIVGCSSECELALREAAKHEVIKYNPGTNDYSILDESKLSDQQKIISRK